MSETQRSSLAEVRNPMLLVPEVVELARFLPDSVSHRAYRMLLAISKDFRARADVSWSKSKPPLAAYWASNAVHFKHLAHVLSRVTRETKKVRLPQPRKPEVVMVEGVAMVALADYEQHMGQVVMERDTAIAEAAEAQDKAVAEAMMAATARARVTMLEAEHRKLARRVCAGCCNPQKAA